MVIRFTVRVFRECLSTCTCASFSLDLEGGICDLTEIIARTLPFFYFTGKAVSLYDVIHVGKYVLKSIVTIVCTSVCSS